ncbi:E3 ubiquitin-protein ligase TRIM56-like [Asterias amurensis]|uniref:E3 ubiquitin-protein ligase TRIM56-like n=1 Tax=Asterias amurensis TaxID=7602 RepID=UPI003AB8D8DB
MASAGDERVFSMNDLKAALLTCSVCLDSESDGQLKLLNCHHTVCTNCLTRLINGKPDFACPKCRRVMAVPTEGVQGIQTNFIAAQIKDFADQCKVKMDTVAKVAGTTCSGCKEMVTDAKHQCNYCGYLCDTCKWKHYDDKTLHQHTVLPLSSKAVNKTHTILDYCAKHHLCHTNLFCARCKVAICKMCKEIDHGDHRRQVQSISEVATASMTEMQGLLEAVMRRRGEVLLKFRKVRDAEARVKADTGKAKTQLGSYFQECRNILSQREFELIGSVEHQSQQLQKLLLYSRVFAQDLHAKLKSTLEYAEHINKLTHPLEVIRAVNALKPVLLNLAATDIDTDVACGNIQFLTAQKVQTDLVSFQNVVASIGKSN